MTKTKKRTARFLQESADLFSTSDFSGFKKPKRKKATLQAKAASAEQRSRKVIAKLAPVKELSHDSDTTSSADSNGRDDWLHQPL